MTVYHGDAGDLVARLRMTDRHELHGPVKNDAADALEAQQARLDSAERVVEAAR